MLRKKRIMSWPKKLKRQKKPSSCRIKERNEEKQEHEVLLKKQRVDESHSFPFDNEQIKEYLKSYAQEYGEKKIHSWDEDLGQLTDSIERVSFNAWLRGRISTGLKTKNKGTKSRLKNNTETV
jgi:hypothetical protein